MNMEKSGEITVFLSLTLTCICALMCGLLESVRLAGSGWYLQMAANSALDSLMSCYHRDVWEGYHLLLLEYEDETGLEKELEPFLMEYLSEDSPYRLKDSHMNILPPVSVTSQDGKYLEQEILDYMKYGIFNMEKNPEKLSSMWKDIKEADSLGDITETSYVDVRKVSALEKAVENIGSSLKKQEQYLEEGEKQLKESNGNGFMISAGKLEAELDRIPGLVEKYEKEADELAGELEESRVRAEAKKDSLSDETWQMISSEMNAWKEYTDEEGSRRKQIEEVKQQAAGNLLIVKSAIEEAEETQEYIDDWEADDDDDELDEQELWDEVYDTINRFHVNRSFTGTGIKDRQKMNTLEGISRLAGADLLSMVMPQGKSVSAGMVNSSRFPSHTALYSADGGGIISILAPKELLETALINEYAAYHFTSFISDPETLTEGKKDFQYEQEYILYGSDTDRENLKETVNSLVKVRGALNLIHLLKDPEKRGEADALAAVITGAAGIAPLSRIVSYFIMTVWAFGEALEDVRILLNGGSIPLIKSAGDWHLSLSQMMQQGVKDSASDGKESGKGLDYQGYLKLFLFIQNRIEKDFRMMDMIQENISRKQPGFLMEKCAYRLDTECRAEGKYGTINRKSSKAY